MKSLKEQFLKAGLTDKQTVKNARKQKQPKLAKKHRGETTESAKLAEQAQLDKTNRDKQLNQQRQLQAEAKAQVAQINQLVENSKIDHAQGDLAYNFTVKGKIKTIYITQDQQKQLIRNQIAIVMLTLDNFEIVPKVVAQKISQRDASYIVANTSSEESGGDQDDPYADYQIPDDLVW